MTEALAEISLAGIAAACTPNLQPTPVSATRTTRCGSSACRAAALHAADV
jgi:hypothetical protein